MKQRAKRPGKNKDREKERERERYNILQFNGKLKLVHFKGKSVDGARVEKMAR